MPKVQVVLHPALDADMDGSGAGTIVAAVSMPGLYDSLPGLAVGAE
jgi:hypothetical protein